MKSITALLSTAFLVWPALHTAAAESPPPSGRTAPMFDGVTLAGWEGDPKLWRAQDGALTGGSLTETVQQNEFLASTRDYTNFIVRFQIRLLGTNGFLNSGFQIRSQRVSNNSEMAGYQCDCGEPSWYGCIYDESRRNKVVAASDMTTLRPALNPDKEGWNEYVIRADGSHITTWLNGADDAWTESDITLDGPFTVETWVRLDSGIDNNDGILGAPGALDMNFAGEQFRVYVGGDLNDVIIAKKKVNPEIWTHFAVTRDAAGKFRIYLNGELDTADSKVAPQKFEHCRIGWTTPDKGTAGWLSEFRVWNRVRTPEEIRGEFDRSYEGNQSPGLACYFSGGQWGKLQAGARVAKTQDFPSLLTAAQSQALAEKFSQFHVLAEKPGDLTKGKALFTTVCQVCHSVGGQGGEIGPVLSGAGALGVEALLRNLLTPNAAMEPGYRAFRVELKDGDVLDGRLMSEDKDAFILRRPSTPDLRIARAEVLRSRFTKTSMMPEGLLDALKPEDVSDLFAYLTTLK